MPERPTCTGSLKMGDPCPNKARPGTDPPRCGHHLYDGEHAEHPKKERALNAYANTGNVRLSCQAADIGRTTWYRWINEDPAFAASVMLAEQDAADHLEAVARKRAIDGSDVLTIFLLKGLRPEKFRDGPRTIVQAGAGFDAQGRPVAAVQISEGAESLAEQFARFRDGAIEATSREVEAG